jgi:peptidyl-prolyl cis-trans isomerase C
LRDPLPRFLLGGALLFVVYDRLHPDATVAETRGRIEITPEELHQLQLGWAMQWQRPPTPTELQSLVDAAVREEVLYREAVALGLDQGDTIVRRRLAQKMDFLAEDVAALSEPTPDELRAWYATHRDQFALPAVVTFRHLYFSTDVRGERARDDADSALARLRGAGTDTALPGDPFMFQDHYGDRSAEQIANTFGMPFAQAVVALPALSWQGPVESGLGWHLVWVDANTPSRMRAIEEIEPAVREAWFADQRTESKRRAFETMRARYEIVVPEVPAP